MGKRNIRTQFLLKIKTFLSTNDVKKIDKEKKDAYLEDRKNSEILRKLHKVGSRSMSIYMDCRRR